VVPGQYVSALAIFSAGTSLSWARDQICQDLVIRAAHAGVSTYRMMDEEAARSSVGANGVLFNPSLAGGNTLDATAAIRGAFLNLDLRHTRADLLRAVMEGVAMGLRNVLDELRIWVPISEPLTLVGGGANSPFWRQMFADVYHMPVISSKAGQQAAALGAAAVAAVGAGLWNDFTQIDALTEVAIRNEPDVKRASDYECLLAKYRQAAELLGHWTKGRGTL